MKNRYALCLLSLVLILPLPALSQKGTAQVTFFRENQSMVRQMGQFKSDYVGPGMRWNIYMDGRKLVVLHRDRMVSFNIPAGRHDFKMDKAPMVSLDVKPGSHIFMRPTIESTHHKLSAHYVFKVVDCKDFVEAAAEIKPIKAGDISTGVVAPSGSFADRCAASK